MAALGMCFCCGTENSSCPEALLSWAMWAMPALYESAQTLSWPASGGTCTLMYTFWEPLLLLLLVLFRLSSSADALCCVRLESRAGCSMGASM